MCLKRLLQRYFQPKTVENLVSVQQVFDEAVKMERGSSRHFTVLLEDLKKLETLSTKLCYIRCDTCIVSYHVQETHIDVKISVL